MAETELVRRGLRVVARNQRTRLGEIDLVCRDRDGYVFVEVKTSIAASSAASHDSPPAGSRCAASATRGGRVMIAALTVGVDGTRVELIEAS
jgi:putative endonuclease